LRLVFVVIMRSVYQTEQPLPTKHVVPKSGSISDFDGFLKVLNPSLKVSGYILVLLYERGKAGAFFIDLERWVHPSMRRKLRRTLKKMVDDDALLHETDAGLFLLTKLGRHEVEQRNLHNIE
jgi:hypothetical protein